MSAITKKYLDELTYQVVGASIEVHKHNGKRFVGKRLPPVHERGIKL